MASALKNLTASVASRVFVITGGASGIGAATARTLAKQGAAAVHIGDWNEANFANIKKEINDINPSTKVYAKKVDVSDSSSVQTWIDGVVKESGAIHGALNGAGLPQIMANPTADRPMILQEKDTDIDKIINVNYKGVIYCTRAQAAVMTKMASGSNPSIVNIASMASIMHIPGGYTYSASKAAVAHFSQCVARDLAPFGVRVNAVSPGNILTAMTDKFVPENAREMMKGGADPHDVARAIVWMLSEASLGINGTNTPVAAI